MGVAFVHAECGLKHSRLGHYQASKTLKSFRFIAVGRGPNIGIPKATATYSENKTRGRRI